MPKRSPGASKTLPADELSKRRLLESYERHNDDRALDQLVELFTPDGLLRMARPADHRRDLVIHELKRHR